MNRTAIRSFLAFLCVLASAIASPALAQVYISFHSFNGSMFFGRYPHAFVVFEGTLDSTGEKIDENYGFSAKTVGPSILMGPVKQVIESEKPKWIPKTNNHFTIPISDKTYFAMKAEIARWRDAPGDFYDLKHRNCIHFVGRMAEMAGLKVDFPEDLLRKPRAWLNHITMLNPQLHAKPIK